MEKLKAGVLVDPRKGLTIPLDPKTKLHATFRICWIPWQKEWSVQCPAGSQGKSVGWTGIPKSRQKHARIYVTVSHDINELYTIYLHTLIQICLLVFGVAIWSR